MNNYYIDASVYAYPFNKDTQNEEYINNLSDYIDRIEILDDVINFNKQFHIKYFLSYRDIVFLEENNLDLTEIDINELSINRNVKMGLEIAQDSLEKIYRKILTDPDPGKSNKASKYIDFDEWFMIRGIDINSEPDDISMLIRNKELRDNTIKNMAIIAALNKYVYKNSKNNDVFNIILNSDINLNNIQITAGFTINMFHFSGVDKDNKKVRYIYKIKDFPKNDFIQISNQNVNFSKIDVLNEEKFNYSWNDDHNMFIENVKKEFTHIEFNSNCAIELEKYRRKIEEKKLDKIEEWKKQFYDVLYANLRALNNFLDIDNKAGIGENERYHGCRDGCDRLINCGAHIRYFGADCVDEKKEDKGKPGVEEDRTINNKQFWLHLRPYTMSCDDVLWFLTLRIHFRWITNRIIEIGSIGRHRYLPCPKRDPGNGKIKDCRRPKCPIYQDPNGNEYQNFLKQWT